MIYKSRLLISENLSVKDKKKKDGSGIATCSCHAMSCMSCVNAYLKSCCLSHLSYLYIYRYLLVLDALSVVDPKKGSVGTDNNGD